MDKNKVKVNKRQRRRVKVRTKVNGTDKRPRLSVFRSLKGIYVQLVDDVSGKTLVSVSSREASNYLKSSSNISNDKGKVGEAFRVGELVAKKAIEKGIKRVVFDRGGNKYHGRVKAVADGARKGGLKF